jgi:signal peptidase
MRSMRLLRRSLLVAWSAMVVVLLVGLFASHAIGLMGLRPYIIRGGSMEPSIPLGAVVAVGNVSIEDVVPGDVLTVQPAGRPVITHRVLRLLNDTDGTVSLVTKGDANAHTDGAAVPASAILGRVHFSVPLIGYLMAALQVPGTIISLLSGLGALLMGIGLLEEDEREREAVAADPPAPPDGHHLPGLGVLAPLAVPITADGHPPQRSAS